MLHLDRKTPKQIALLIAVLLERHHRNRMNITREHVRKLGGRREAPESWYAEIIEELRELEVVMFPAGERYSVMQARLAKNWMQVSAKNVAAIEDQPDYDALAVELHRSRLKAACERDEDT